MTSLKAGIEDLEVVESYKLLGLMVRSDLRWIDNTKFIISKAYKRIWVLRRLKKLGTPVEELITVYKQQIRSHLELSVVVWHPGLTVHERMDIERIQRVVCHIILGENYTSYDEALSELNLCNLNTRRINLCLRFANKAAKHP